MRHIIIMLFIFCCTFFTVNKPVRTKNPDWYHVHDMKLERFNERSGPRTYLLSFPGSGNSWMRYCLEFLTKRPTLEMSKKYIAKINCPLGYWHDLGTDYQKDPIWKVHYVDQMKAMGSFDPSKETLIVVVRNPKEVLARMRNILSVRDSGVELDNQCADELCNSSLMLNYFQLLQLYDEWRPNRRLLIYYEDLLHQPKEVFSTLLAFLQASDEYLDDFLVEYERHKKTSLSLYAQQEDAPVTKGKTTKYHCYRLSEWERRRFDQTCATYYGELWQRYLSKMYAETTQ